jgi:hypothetical protein
MGEVDVNKLAEGLERTVASIDEQINNLKKRERNSEIHAKLILARGRAMRGLASISTNKEELLGYAIGSATEAVNLFNKLRIEHECARAHYELSLSYLALSEIKEKDRNHDIAIRALDEAKEFINYDDDPKLYNMIEAKLKEVWKEY